MHKHLVEGSVSGLLDVYLVDLHQELIEIIELYSLLSDWFFLPVHQLVS